MEIQLLSAKLAGERIGERIGIARLDALAERCLWQSVFEVHCVVRTVRLQVCPSGDLTVSTGSLERKGLLTKAEISFRSQPEQLQSSLISQFEYYITEMTAAGIYRQGCMGVEQLFLLIF